MASVYEKRIERRLMASFLRSPEEKSENERISRESHALIGLPISKWPDFSIHWDLRIESQRFAFDGCDRQTFFEDHPEGLKIFDVDLSKLDNHLSRMFQQTPHEFWAVGYSSKKARIIFEWIEEKKLTPPIVQLHEDGYQLVLGGNHRLAVARAKGEIRVPILVLPEEADRIKVLLDAVDLQAVEDLRQGG